MFKVAVGLPAHEGDAGTETDGHEMTIVSYLCSYCCFMRVYPVIDRLISLPDLSACLFRLPFPRAYRCSRVPRLFSHLAAFARRLSPSSLCLVLHALCPFPTHFLMIVTIIRVFVLYVACIEQGGYNNHGDGVDGDDSITSEELNRAAKLALEMLTDGAEVAGAGTPLLGGLSGSLKCTPRLGAFIGTTPIQTSVASSNQGGEFDVLVLPVSATEETGPDGSTNVIIDVSNHHRAINLGNLGGMCCQTYE